MASFDTQFKNMVASWNLDVKDVKKVYFLTSFHEIMRGIYQRNDTLQYIYIETEDSFRDGVDDYFKWYYIEEDRINKLLADSKFNHRIV